MQSFMQLALNIFEPDLAVSNADTSSEPGCGATETVLASTAACAEDTLTALSELVVAVGTSDSG